LIGGLRMFARLVGLFATFAVLVPAQLVVLAFARGRASLVLPRLAHRATCALLGLRIEVRGGAAPGHVVFLANHLSYLDVAVIGSLLPVRFIAKDDVRAWPLLGVLSRLQQTVFVSRSPRRAAQVVAQLAAALASGHDLVLFPEGTTSDGRGVRPFKSSLFAALADPALQEVVLQPVSLELLAVDGRGVGQGGDRDGYAYYRDMRLLPHLARFLRLSGASLRLTLHAPLPPAKGLSRKELALLAQARVAHALARPQPVLEGA
jgi:1-acyl-sn-glycerol-3-phosphate acyltransferase